MMGGGRGEGRGYSRNIFPKTGIPIVWIGMHLMQCRADRAKGQDRTGQDKHSLCI